MKREVEATQSFDHEYVVKYHVFKKSTLVKRDGRRVPVAYIVQDKISGGELFDYVANSGAFTEPQARYYLRQLLTGLNYIHTAGFAHRDLKPENILLDD